MESIKLTAEEYKQKGNDFFKQNNFEQAINQYTNAIEIDPNNPKTAVYYANRSYCQIKMENYGLALQDAKLAIEKDPQYVKGYYRQGSAYLILNKLEDARDSFKTANNLTQNKDQDIKEKLKTIKQMIYQREFLKSIERDEPKKAEINFKDIEVPATYNGPRLEEGSKVTKEWCEELMEYMKQEKKLHKKYVLYLLKQFQDIIEKYPSLIDLNYPEDVEFTVCGDTHGQYYDVLNIFKINGNPSPINPYLFNGDFVDRGSFSVEVILCLIAWKVCYPDHFHMTRGNHETKNMNKLYGFEGEVTAKYDATTFEIFSNIFQYLPLGYVLNKRVLVNHGGLFAKENVKLDDLRKINRVCEPPDEGLMTDMLWSDPVKENGRHPSKRGVSIGFGPDVAHKFLQDNQLDMLIRSHEMKPEGYEVEADGKVITVFSAPNYCDQMGNKGAFIKFLGKDMKPKFVQFTAVEHPKVPVMAYSKSMYNFYQTIQTLLYIS